MIKDYKNNDINYLLCRMNFQYNYRLNTTLVIRLKNSFALNIKSKRM